MASRAPHGIARRRTSSGLAVLVAGALLVAGCSSDGGSDDAAPERTTTTEAAERTTSTTGVDDATTTTAADPVTTTTAAPAPPGAGPTEYTGTIDGQEDSTVGFVRDGASITGFEARGVQVECQPLAVDDDAKSRTVSVDIGEAAVAADGTVEHTEEGANLAPSLSGAFADDGTFTGGLFLTGEDDGYVCGGDLTFLAGPG